MVAVPCLIVMCRSVRPAAPACRAAARRSRVGREGDPWQVLPGRQPLAAAARRRSACARTRSASCGRRAQRQFGPRPVGRQAGREAQLRRPQLQAEDRLDGRAVQPGRRAGVPAPAAAAHVGRLRVDVAGHHVGLDAVGRAAARVARAVRRAQVGEVAVGDVRVARAGSCTGQRG